MEAGVVLDSSGAVPDQDPGHGSKKQTTRRHRRKLPEIPKHKKRRVFTKFNRSFISRFLCLALEGVVPASIFEELSAATPSWVGPLLPGQGQECQVLLARGQESHVLTSRGQDTRVPRDQDTSDVSFNVHNPASMMLNLVNCK